MHDYNSVKRPSYTFYWGNVVCVPVRFFCPSLRLIFTLMAASIFHFLTTAIKFSCFLLTKFVSFVYVRVNIKIYSKKDSAQFSLKVLVAMRFTTNMRGCLKCEISPQLIWKAGRTDARSSAKKQHFTLDKGNNYWKVSAIGFTHFQFLLFWTFIHLLTQRLRSPWSAVGKRQTSMRSKRRRLVFLKGSRYTRFDLFTLNFGKKSFDENIEKYEISQRG